MRFFLKIATPETTLIQDHVDAVELPAVDGICTLLPNHSSSFIALHAGTILVHQSGESERWFITGGTCHFADNLCTINVDEVIESFTLDANDIAIQLKQTQTLSAKKRQLLEAQLVYLTKKHHTL